MLVFWGRGLNLPLGGGYSSPLPLPRRLKDKVLTLLAIFKAENPGIYNKKKKEHINVMSDCELSEEP
jgi:hypothetical protein